MNTSRYATIGASVATVACLFSSGCEKFVDNRAVVDQAAAQVRRIAAELDERTTESGVYIRVKGDEIKENDPWGRRLQVKYSQGGVAEIVSVRSAGPDGQFHTNDDVVAECMAANFKGVGEGIKKNTQETAAKAAKGLVKGTVEGVKESVKENLPFKKKKVGAAASNLEDEQGARPEADKPGK